MSHEIDPHVSRMLVERYQLFQNEIKLNAFIAENPTFQTLDQEDKDLMNEQLTAMTEYREILERRIKRAERK